MQNPVFQLESLTGSDNKGVVLYSHDDGSKEISALKDDHAVWASYTSLVEVANAIALALNARFSLPNDGVFVSGSPTLSGSPIGATNIIE